MSIRRTYDDLTSNQVRFDCEIILICVRPDPGDTLMIISLKIQDKAATALSASELAPPAGQKLVLILNSSSTL